MEVAVVGGGIVGLFAARDLEHEGADVTVYDATGPGAGSVHAAGIIEPATAYRTNTFAFLRRVRRLVRRGVCTFRGVDSRWAVESVRQMERTPVPGTDEGIRELSDRSVAVYRDLAAIRNDFDYAERGLLERFDDARHYAEQREEALAVRSTVPVEVRADVGVGGLFFPQVSWLDTARLVDRVVREQPRTRWLARTVDDVRLDGTVACGAESHRYDAVVVCAGVACRRLGLPLTGVRGYGWHVRTRAPVPQATIWVDRGIAAVPLTGAMKVTGGWDFDLGGGLAHARRVLQAIREVVDVESIIDFKHGSRPCTPDGLPTVGRRDRVVVATGGFRLGWSFGPGLGRHAAELSLGREANDRFLARYCGGIRDGDLR